MSYTRKVAYNTVAQVVGKVITTFISLILIATITRYLGVAGYGAYTTIFAYTQFFSVLADFGFFWFLLREISKPDADTQKIVNNVLTFRSILAVAIFVMAFLVGFLIPQYHDLRYGIGIIAAASFWASINGTYVGIFQKNLRMDRASLTDVLGRIVTFGLVYWQIHIGAPLTHILWAYFFGNMVNFFASAFMGRIYVTYRPAFDLKFWKIIFFECLPISMVTVLGIIYFKVDTIILSLLKSPTDVGIYGPPYKVVEILILFPGIFMGNVFPIFVNYIYSKDNRLHEAYQKAFDFLVISAVPVVLGVIFTSPRIIRIVAGEDFVTAHTIGPVWGFPATSPLVMQILVVAVGISFVSHVFGYMVIALGKQTKLVWPNLAMVIFNISLNLILIPRISYVGAAVVTVLTETFIFVAYWWIMHRYIDLRLNLKPLWKVAVSGIILALVLKYFGHLNLWMLVPLAGIVYLGMLFALKGIPKNMVATIIKRG